MSDEPIVRIAARGDGITADGRHAPQSAPGDLLGIDGTLTHGPHHVDPPCRHYPACGGCQLQHVDDESFSQFLVDRIVGALNGQKLDAPPIRPVHISPPFARRRVSLRAERKGRRVTIGFNEEQSHTIVDLKQCDVMAPELFALLAPLRILLLQLLKDKRAGNVQMTLADQGVDLLLDKVEADDLAAVEALTDFAQAHRLARLSLDTGNGAEARWEPLPVTITLGGVAVPLPVSAFLQATADGEAKLVATVREIVGDAAQVVDLFAGLGTFALALDARVLAVEGARDAALALKAGAGRVQRMLVVELRDLSRRPLTRVELGRFDAVVLDPPRAGAREQMVELAAADVARIAYVSCNPATFARDARTLTDAGWRLEWIQPVGQFRWSTHAELVGSFSR